MASGTIGYVFSGGANDSSGSPGLIHAARGLVADVDPGGFITHLYARIGSYDTTHFTGTIWDEAGNPLGSVAVVLTGANAVAEVDFDFSGSPISLPADTYFYFSVQADEASNPILQRQVFIDEFAYGDNLSYPAASLSPSDNLVGTNCIYVYWETAAGPPVNTVPPVVSGATNLMGVVLTTTNGSWSGVPTSYTYQWQRDCGSGFVDITGETASSYTTGVEDVGCLVACEVTAYN